MNYYFDLDIHCNLPDEIWCLIAKKKKTNFDDLFNFSIVSESFYYVSRVDKKFVSTMRFSKCIVNFDPDYFEFWMSWSGWVKIFVRSLMKKLLKSTMCLVWVMSCLKRLPIVCFLSKKFAIVLIVKETVKQQVNVMFAQGFLSMAIVLG